MVFLKGVLFLIPLAFLFLRKDWSGAAAAAGVTAALFLWALEPKERHRLTTWCVAGLGILVMFYREAPGFLIGAAIPLAVLIGLELLAKRTGDEEPPRGAVLGGSIACGLAAAFLAFTGAPGALYSADQLPRRVVCIGDSLTAGVPNDGVQQLWPDILQARLGPGAEVLNFSHPGDTAGAAWQRWENTVTRRQWRTGTDWQPQLIIVLLGGNDILRRQGAAGLERDLRTWAEALQHSRADILFIPVPGGVLADNYRHVWRNVAADHGFAVMDQETLRRVFTRPEMTIADRIHMSQQGHEYLAGEVYRRIGGR